MKKAIVSFGNSNGNYIKALNRLKHSMEGNFDGDILTWTDESELGCPKHSQNPYAFKPYAMRSAFMKGYEKVLWLDTSVWAIKSMKPVFEKIAEDGVFFENSGFPVSMWSNDACLKYFGISRKEAESIRMISSGFVGIDIDNPIGAELYEKWFRAMEAGAFKGSWTDHRHDQTALSIIIAQMGLDSKITECGTFFAYSGPEYKEPNESAVCLVQGM